jgi:hypothetical protein
MNDTFKSDKALDGVVEAFDLAALKQLTIPE